MSKNEKNNLKLIGENKEDFKIISAYIQDSIVAVGDIVFLEENRILIIIEYDDVLDAVHDCTKYIQTNPSALEFIDKNTLKNR